jgi:lysozyme
MIEELTKQLKRDEGVRPWAYADHLGYLTIGVGRLIDPRKNGRLRDSEIDLLLSNDILDRIAAVRSALPWFDGLDEPRKGVLLNMAFQMGTEGMLAFTTTLAHVRAGRYADASKAMLKSKWATQTPARAQRLAKQMEDGTWQ